MWTGPSSDTAVPPPTVSVRPSSGRCGGEATVSAFEAVAGRVTACPHFGQFTVPSGLIGPAASFAPHDGHRTTSIARPQTICEQAPAWGPGSIIAVTRTESTGRRPGRSVLDRANGPGYFGSLS